MMVKKLLAVYVVGLLIAFCGLLPDPASAWAPHGAPAASNPSIPLLVSGTAVPTSGGPTQPSLSTWDPSCLDATWGNGTSCNLTTHTCVAPTSGAPYQPCQPPHQLTVTGSSYSGGVARINYTSYANYAYPVGSPLLVSGALTPQSANWNTPIAGVTSVSVGGSSPNYTVTLGLQPRDCGNPCGTPFTSAPFAVGQTISVGSVTGTEQGASNSVTGQGWHTFVSVAGSGMTASTTVNNVPMTVGGVATGGYVSITSDASGNVTLVTRYSVGTEVNGNVIGVNTTGFAALAGLTGFSATLNAITPNGQWTVINCGGSCAPSTTSVTFSTGLYQVSGTFNTPSSFGNLIGWNGTVQAPWTVASSSCASTSCFVTFNTSNSCTSSCVSASTQIVAGQNDDAILAWHFGETIPNSIQNGDVPICVIPKHISTFAYAAASLNNGPWVQVTSLVADPWGQGKSTLAAPANPYAACWHFNAASVSDGPQEVRAVACFAAGNCIILSSVKAGDVATGSTTISMNSHGYGAIKQIAISKSFDTGCGGANGGCFQNFDWRDYIINPVAGTTGVTTTSASAATGTFTLNFTQPPNVKPIHTGEVVNVLGTTATGCSITGGTPSGANLIITFSGGCSFPTNSTIAISGVTLGTTPISSGTYNNSTGVYSVTLANAPNGAAPQATGQINGYSIMNKYFVTGVTGGSTSTLTGWLTGVSNAGKTLTFQGTAGIGAGTTISSSTSLVGNSLAWNSDTSRSVPVLSGTDVTPGQVTVSSSTTSVWASGGTIRADWDGDCIATSASGSGTLTCPTANDPSVAPGGTATITAQGNLYVTVGGAGDWTAPYRSDVNLGGQLTPDTIQLIAQSTLVLGSGVNAGNANTTGCSVSPCGSVATPPTGSKETIWLTTFQAGMDERSPHAIPLNPDGSLFIYTNAGHTLKGVNAYVDSWNQTAVTSGCLSPVPVSAGIFDTTMVAYTGAYCNNFINAKIALTPNAHGLAQSLSNVTVSGNTCLVFNNSLNEGSNSSKDFYLNQPLEFVGYDTNTNPSFANWNFYWVQSVGVNNADDITLSAYPGGPCINDTAANIFGLSTGATVAASRAQLYGDIGMDNVVFACDTTVTNPCSNSNPQSVLAGAAQSNPSVPYVYAKTSWFGLIPDRAPLSTFPSTQAQINLMMGYASWWGGPTTGSATAQGGRVRVAVDSQPSALSLTAAVGVTKTPPVVTVTGGSLATCAAPNAAHQCETLTFTAPASGGVFQTPTGTGSPGQGIFASGILGSGGTWTCGTFAAPCNVVAATSTSATFINDSASGSWSSGGTQRILPANIILEFAQGTFAGNGTTTGLCAVSNVSVNTGSAKVCFAGVATGPSGGGTTGTNSTAWPWYQIPGGFITNLATSANCIPIQGGQSSQLSINTVAGSITPGTGSNNDIVTIIPANQGSAGQPANYTNGTFSWQAYANCNTPSGGTANTGPFVFANSMYNIQGTDVATMTDVWADGRDVLPNASIVLGSYNGLAGDTNPGSSLGGAAYVTNANFQNSGASGDQSSYVWGMNSAYNPGVCVNHTNNVVSSRCVGNPSATPFSLGGNNTTGALRGPYFNQVIGALDASGTTQTSIGPTTASLEFAQGTIPGNVVPGQNAYITCNFPSGGIMPMLPTSYSVTANVGGSGGAVVTIGAFDNNANPVVMNVTNNTVITGTCPLANNPWVTLNNIVHTDAVFYDVTGVVSPSEFGLQYIFYNNTAHENVACPGCAFMQVGLHQGGAYINMAYEDGDYEVLGAASPGQQFNTNGWRWQGYTMFNRMFRNTKIWGNISVVADTSPTNNLVAASPPMQDDYMINVDGGPNFLGYPTQSNLNPIAGGWRGGTASQNIGITGSQNLAIWPPLTGGVDANGLPALPTKPGPANFAACPWYCGFSAGNGNM